VIAPALLLSLLPTGSALQDPTSTSGLPLPPEQAAFDVLHYDLALRVYPEKRSIDGALTMRARVVEPTEAILLDLDDRLDVGRVSSGDRRLRFDHDEGRIRVRSKELFAEPGAEFELVVEYGGKPRVATRPPWDGGFTWERTGDGSPWIATSCQGEGADLWWPCKDQPSDEPDAFDLHVTVPVPLVCASNGRLVSREDAGKGWQTWNWHVSTPINNYGIALNIAPYATIEGELQSVAGETFPVTYWVLPENRAKGEALFEEILADLRFFEDVFGPYPFRIDKYGVAETPHLGMEHQSITAYGNGYQGNPWGKQQGFDFLLHHEMAHEWWANLVTARNWNDFWIHEGFGTYAQALYVERLHGLAEYHVEMAQHRRNILNRGAVAPRGSRATEEMYFSEEGSDSPGGDIYDKGSWILHTLRYLLGDETFFRVLRRMAYPDPALEKITDGGQCRFATTDELLAIAEEHSGRELDWFFELYLRQPALPELEHDVKGGELRLSWKTPQDLPFPMPVEVLVGGERTRVEMPEGWAAVEVGRATWELDPDDWVLREGNRSAPRRRR